MPSNYLQNKDGMWWDYQKQADSSWYWRKIVAVKNIFKERMEMQEFTVMKYTIQHGYGMLEEQHQPFQWFTSVWDRLSIPKHRFIL